MVQKCPACKGENTELEISAQKKFLRCLDCQYDERIISAQIPIEDLVKQSDLSWHKPQAPQIGEDERDQRVQWLAQEQQKLREQRGMLSHPEKPSAFRSSMEREANQGRDANEKYTAEHSDKERERELGPISYDASKARSGKGSGSMGYESGKGGGGAEYSSDSVHAKSYDEALAEACCSHPDVAKFHEKVHKKGKDQYLV